MNNMKIHTLKIGRRYEAYRRKIHCVVRYDDEEEGKINFFLKRKKKNVGKFILSYKCLPACLLARLQTHFIFNSFTLILFLLYWLLHSTYTIYVVWRNTRQQFSSPILYLGIINKWYPFFLMVSGVLCGILIQNEILCQKGNI